MSQPNARCTVCGGSNFIAEAGFFFCSECNTQSQDYREEVYDDYFGTQKVTTRVLQKKTQLKPKDQDEKLTSWEVLNYILKGITEEMIELGAKPSLKIIVLQLWASYLQKLEIAFTSVQVERKPKLGYAFKRSDAEIVYGLSKKDLKAKSWRSRSRGSSAASSASDISDSGHDTSASGTVQSRRSILRRLTLRKKALASAEYSQQSQDTARSFSQSQTLEQLESNSETEDTPKKWVEEGHISLRTASKFLPASVKLDTQLHRMLDVHHMSYVKCRQLMSALCYELDVVDLPQPNVARLTERYCLELQLPGEICEMVKNLMRLSLNSEVCKVKLHESSSTEVQVMTAIIIVMKLVFSLDGCTEYKLSHTASEINSVCQTTGDHQKLFVLTEWMQFVECRKAVVASCHQPTSAAVYGQAFTNNIGLFLQHYKQVAADRHRETNNRYALNKHWVEALTRCLANLTKSSQVSDEVFVDLPPSLTPLYSATQHLLTQHAERVSAVRHILAEDYTRQSLTYTTQPDRLAGIGMVNDLNIIQLDGAAATFKVENIALRARDNQAIPRHGINKLNVKAGVVKKLKPAKTRRDSLPIEVDETQLSFVKEIVSDDSDEEEKEVENTVQEPESNDAQFELYSRQLDIHRTCSQYWFCHTKLSKNDLTLDEFDLLSKKTFQSSFLWLLKECSRMIHNTTKDLYANIIFLENKYQHVLNGAQFLKTTCKNRQK
ncbi:TATA box-binding protein-associated factor RNA polymerase I subunit B isoform X2 [Macrosteles quadrilineatus]|uniref:TATA box-binding protein-associated factor RNA polymerase I subunit B isoform X2 n=1 Tax=Macrosteles quadrilineatus TaxID=74068 RepID=UPI0023E19D01|nr:TATA box-binding protein-associated factor RNA polymerase I subunit B isoform X2 [Macrosteles quadrilineatus]